MIIFISFTVALASLRPSCAVLLNIWCDVLSCVHCYAGCCCIGFCAQGCVVLFDIVSLCAALHFVAFGVVVLSAAVSKSGFGIHPSKWYRIPRASFLCYHCNHSKIKTFAHSMRTHYIKPESIKP